MPDPYRRLIAVFIVFVSTAGLAGCLRDVIPFTQRADYQITGVESDKETQDYLNKILQERVAENIDYEEDSADFQRAETAREQLIAADLVKALKAKGYYDAQVDYTDNKEKSLTGQYEITPGEIYSLSSISVAPEGFRKFLTPEIIKTGEALEAQAVLKAQTALYDSIQKNKCYFSVDVTHSVILDEETKTADLTYNITLGPEVKFGPAIFEGQESVEESYLRKMVPWKEGDCFRQEKIRNLLNKILATGLFVRADSSLPEAPSPDARVPVTIQLKERAPRSVKAGFSYYTDEGAGATLGWEHRNILGSGEKLDIELNISQINQSLKADFTKPYFLRKDQSLEINSALRQQDTDAFEETAFEIGSSVKRQIHKRLQANLGVQFTFSEIVDEDDRHTYGLLSFPGGLTYDNRDNPLDPHKGWYLTGDIEPFYDMLGESDPFTKLEAGSRTYLDIGGTPDLVLALRANIGSLIGSDTADIPAVERFYGGGGGSIRGFGYQQVGPFENGDPTGGRSIVTSSAEFRLKFSDTFGGVAFVDAGSVSENSAPDFDNLAVGAGVGARYYTGFGPLRFDVAVPLNQKENLDQNYQFYISIGQAF